MNLKMGAISRRVDIKLIISIMILIVISSLVALKLPLDGDEIANLEVSKNLFKGYHPETVYSEWGFWHHPPLYYTLLYPLSFNPIFARLLSILFSCLTLIVIHKLGSGYAQLYYALIPTVLIFSAVIRPDILMLLLMMATFLFFKSHSNIALILSMIGINVKYQYAAILIPILLADRKKFIKFLVVDCLALIPFGAISYVYTKDFLLLSHWTKGLGLPSLTNAFPTDLMLLYLTTISLIASLKDKKLSVYLALILANLFMITLVSPSKFAYKVTYYYLPCFAAGTIALESYLKLVSRKKKLLILAIFMLIVIRQLRFLISILF